MWRNGQDVNEIGESILLLEPKSSTTSSSNNSNNNSNYQASFIGGHPIYYPNDIHYSTLISSSSTTTATTKSTLLKCHICHNHMYLLLQLYTPLDDLHRSLYVFSCNNASCLQSGVFGGDTTNSSKFSLGGGGVIKCLRSQCVIINNNNDDNNVDNDIIDDGIINDTTMVAKNNQEMEEDTNYNDDNNRWSIDEGGWGDNDYDEDNNDNNNNNQTNSIPSMDDLEAMLAAMEANIEGNKKGKSTKNDAKKKKHHDNKNQKNIETNVHHDAIHNDVPAFPKYELDLYDEPATNAFTKVSDDNIDIDDDDDETIGITNKDDKAIQKLLSSYLKDEEDDGIKSMIQSGSYHYNTSKTNVGNGNNMIIGEKYERMSPEDKAFLSFTDRIKRAPYQTVRYAYDGIPLWSIPTPLTPISQKGKRCRDSKFPTVPNCICGSSRKFEFQLMPSLLYVLDVDKYHNKTNINNSNTKDDQYLEKVLNKNEGGMNWGVIAIYSCSNSCNQSLEEYVIVQESVDVNPQKMTIMSAPSGNNNDSDVEDDKMH